MPYSKEWFWEAKLCQLIVSCLLGHTFSNDQRLDNRASPELQTKTESTVKVYSDNYYNDNLISNLTKRLDGQSRVKYTTYLFDLICLRTLQMSFFVMLENTINDWSLKEITFAVRFLCQRLLYWINLLNHEKLVP